MLAGLAVGIIFVVAFSLSMTPAQSSFDPVSVTKVDGRIIANTNKMTEVQVFFSEYPDGKVEVDRTGNKIGSSTVKYSFEKVYDDGKVNEFAMFVVIDNASGKPTGQIHASCGVWYKDSFGSIGTIYMEPDLTKTLRTTECAK